MRHKNKKNFRFICESSFNLPESEKLQQIRKEIWQIIYGDKSYKNDKNVIVGIGYKAKEATDSKTKKTYKKMEHGTPFNFYFGGNKEDTEKLKSDPNYVYRDVPGELGGVFTIGNKKLPDDVIIFNMNPASHCPASSSCALTGACYAVNGERQKPANLITRCQNENMLYLLEKKGRLDLIFKLLEQAMYDAHVSGHTIRSLRISEAGDFKSTEMLRKFDEAAERWSKPFYAEGMNDHPVPPVAVYGYTAQSNSDFTSTFSGVTNISFNASLPGINIGREDDVKKAFFAVPKEEFDSLKPCKVYHNENGDKRYDRAQVFYHDQRQIYYYKCPCGKLLANGSKTNCALCSVCMSKMPGIYDENGHHMDIKRFIILIELHGTKKDSAIAQKIIKNKRDSKMMSNTDLYTTYAHENQPTNINNIEVLNNEDDQNIQDDQNVQDIPQVTESKDIYRIKLLMEKINKINNNTGALID